MPKLNQSYEYYKCMTNSLNFCICLVKMKNTISLKNAEKVPFVLS